MAGISNFQIEETFKKIGDEDLLKNFLGVFLPNKMNKLIDHAAMISESGKFPFVIANTDADYKLVFTGGVYLTLNQKMIYIYFLIRLV